MCDYSLNAVKTRADKVDDKLTTRLFGWSTLRCEQVKEVEAKYREEESTD